MTQKEPIRSRYGSRLSEMLDGSTGLDFRSQAGVGVRLVGPMSPTLEPATKERRNHGKRGT